MCRRFRLRRNAVLRFYIDFDCAGSHKVAVPILAISKASFYRVFVHVFGHERHFAWQVQGIRHLWRSETWVYLAGARNRTHGENRGRRSISWTLPKRWQACVIRRSAFYVAGAGNPHHGSYILRSKGLIPERGCIFGTGAWGCFCVASAAFRMTSAHDFVAGTVLLEHGFEMWTLCGDRACRVRGMQVKLRFWISKCNPLRRSCVSSARNAGEIAISEFEVEPFADFTERSCTRGPTTNPDAEILTERSWTKDPHTDILHKRSYRILMQTSWQRDLGQEIRRQRSCTRGPTGSWCRDPDREILHKRFTYRDLAQEVLQDPDADIMTERSWTRDPQTEVWHKRSYRIPMQTSWQRDLGQKILIQTSCTSGPTGFWSCRRDPQTEILHKWFCTSGHTRSWCTHHDREILHKRFAYRDLAQEVPEDPDAEIQRSWHRHLIQKRSSYTDLAQVLLQDSAEEIYRDLARVVIMRRSWHRHLAQEESRIFRSCTSGPRGCWCRNPDRDILQKWYYRILMQSFWHGDLAQAVWRIQMQV